MVSIDMQNENFCNIKYGATEVFMTRLRIGDIDDMSISECVEAVRITRHHDVKILKEIVEDADQREPQWFEEVDGDDGDDSITAKKDMFGPLARIVSTIIEFQPDTENPSLSKRVFRFSPKNLVDDFSLLGFSELAPDIQFVEYCASTRASYNWNDVDCFGEVEPSNKQGPKGEDGTGVPKIVLQTTDYARHYLTCRPLLLFCAGLLIFGTKFCVGIYDREGVVFSTIHDMFDEMDIFVRVIRSFTRVLSIQELGLDHTIEMRTDERTTALTGAPQKVPSAIVPVSPSGLSTTYWCTLGRPTWTSSSRFGSGTAVWTVKQCHRKTFIKRNTSENEEAPVEEWLLSDNIPMVLKTSWRSSSSQTSESEIYQYLQTNLPDLPGLATFEFGGDVHFSECNIRTSSMKPITVRNLRNYPNCSDDVSSSGPTLILHHLVLSTVGDYLWNYDDDPHMLRGFRDALLTHKALTERGFRHRNISPGSIRIVRQKGRDRPTETVLFSDVECALIDHNAITRPALTVPLHEPGETTVRTDIGCAGAPMAGNPQFMAKELLELHLNGAMIDHAVHHDIESFICSMLYCIMRHIAEGHNKPRRANVEITKEQWDTFFERYKTAFGQPTMSDILPHRTAQSTIFSFFSSSNIRMKTLIDAYVSRPVRYLVVEDLNSLLWETRSNREYGKRTHLTYDSVLKPIEQAIHNLEVQASTH